ncbi:MAG: pyrroline-5-carboxylate reductase family protein [Gammaproteobacteria bacterium]
MNTDHPIPAAKIAILGAGHLAEALLEGLIATGVAPHQFKVAAPRAANLQRLATRFAVATSPNNADTVADADWVFLAMRPNQLYQALAQTQNGLRSKLVISALASVSLAQLEALLPASQLIRIMTNLGIAHLCGYTAICASQTTSAPNSSDLHSLHTMLSRLGTADQLHEPLLAPVTALAGSGPGFLFDFLDSLVQAAAKTGLSQAQAQNMMLSVLQSCTRLLQNTPDAAQLRDRVATQGGVTERGLKEFARFKLAEASQAALTAACTKAQDTPLKPPNGNPQQ